MENYIHVRPEHLNHHGYLFGGVLLMWVDECAWMTTTLDFPNCRMVTVAMDEIVFKSRVPSGAILRFIIEPVKRGGSSIKYKVTVYSDEPSKTGEKEVFSTTITFVRIDDDDKAAALPDTGKLRSEIQ